MNIPSNENGCNHYIMTAVNRIRHIRNEDFVIVELGQLESYLSSCLDLQNLSVQTTQTISSLLINLIRHDKLQSSCMRVVYLLLQSTCHPILKNILLGELESEIHNRFPVFPPSLQQIVWFCYQAHLLSTSNSGPLLKFLLFQTRNQEWDKYSLSMTARRVKAIFTNYPEVTLSYQDLLISLMFLLEQVMQDNSSEMFRFCVDCCNFILGHVDSQTLSRLVKQIPDRLTNVLFSLLETTHHNMLAETPSKLQPVMSHHGFSSVDRKIHMVDMIRIPKCREIELIPRQIRLKLSHKLDSRSREKAAECLKEHYWNYLDKMPSQFHSASNENLSSVLSWFVKLAKDDNCRVVYKVLQALEAVFKCLSRDTIEKHVKSIVGFLLTPALMRSKLVQRSLQKLVTVLLHPVSAELIFNEIFRLATGTYCFQRQVQCLRAMSIILSHYPQLSIDKRLIISHLIVWLKNKDVQLQDTAIDFAAALSRLLDVQQKHDSTKNGISKFDGDALFTVISESLHNQLPCSIVDPILRKLEERSMDNVEKVRNSLMKVPKTDDFLRMYSRDVNMENGSRTKYQGESQRTYLEIHANENRVKLVLPTANRHPSFANTFETRHNGWKQACQSSAALRTDCRRSSKHKGLHHARHKTFASQSEVGNGELPAPHQAEGVFDCNYAYRKQRTNLDRNSKHGAIAAQLPQLCNNIELSDESMCSARTLNESSVETMGLEDGSENGIDEMIHECYLNQSHATCRDPDIDSTDQSSKKQDNLKTERSEQIPESQTEAKTIFDKEATTTFLATHRTGGVVNRMHSQQSVRRKDFKKSKRTRAKNTWSPKSSSDEISHCLNLLRSSDWERQLEGLKRAQSSLQLDTSGEFDRLFKNEEELRTFTSALLSASRNLRSQVSRAAINTIQAFGNLLTSNGQGFLWDSQADKILHAILARIGGDTSTKFLLNDAYKALEVVVSCLTPARAIVTLSKQVYEQKVKSSNSRLAVATQLDRLILKAKNTSSLPRQLGSDGLQRLLKVSAQFLVDGILNIRICGQNILTVLLNKFDLEETCRRTLSEPQWRNVEKLLVAVTFAR
ncbi:hypothetical protein CRM22_008841 [Opisthorchis felineus]|uniref:TOG domain-containing protein n=1 Tax=Opisthorchis felineus TaxID=147828 RepID=A0A4V6RGT7_OPIFE|nr:hypothetical protein CRM22_008841 [Opisthorchis felineus]